MPNLLEDYLIDTEIKSNADNIPNNKAFETFIDNLQEEYKDYQDSSDIALEGLKDKIGDVWNNMSADQQQLVISAGIFASVTLVSTAYVKGAIIYDKISKSAFGRKVASLFVRLNVKGNKISIKGLNYNRIEKHLKALYPDSPVAEFLLEVYNKADYKKYKKKKMQKSAMRVSYYETYEFFALELLELFSELYEEYKDPCYAKVVQELYKKSWVGKTDHTVISPIDTSNLSHLNKTLFPYQEEFIKRYNLLKTKLNLRGYVLAFEQGLGKTLTATGLAECLNKERVYIVCPNSLKDNWAIELRDYFDKYKDPTVWKEEVYKVDSNFSKFTEKTKYIITNNESISKMYPYTTNHGNCMMIVDESQNFRNLNGTRTNELLTLYEKLGKPDALLCSGTPIKAVPTEIIPTMMIIDPLFDMDVAKVYKKCFNMDNLMGSKIVQTRFGNIIYRKTKDELNLPDKDVMDFKLTLKNPDKYLLENVTKEVRARFEELYYQNAIKNNKDYRKQFIEALDRYSSSTHADKQRYIKLVVDTVNTDKYIEMHDMDVLFTEQYIDKYVRPNIRDKEKLKEFNQLYTNFVMMKQSCMGKANGEILPKYRTEMFSNMYLENREKIYEKIDNCEHKVVIFSMFLGVVNTIYNDLIEHGYGAVKITGDVKDRTPEIIKFKEDPNTEILVATSQTLGTGVTLTEATLMFFFGPPWRSKDFDQCCDRIHRIGQKFAVLILNAVLNTAEPNLSTRMKEIMDWSEDMFSGLIKTTKDEPLPSVESLISVLESYFITAYLEERSKL